MHGDVIVVYLNDSLIVAAFLAFQRPRVVPEVSPAPIAVEMLAKLADGLSAVAAMFETIIVFPLMKFTAFATESPKIGRDIFEQKPRHLTYREIMRGYSGRVGKRCCHQF